MNAFSQFYDDYGRAFKAEKYIDNRGNSFSLDGYSDFVIDGKKSNNLFAEVSSYLSLVEKKVEGGFSRFSVSVGPNTDKSKTGHTGFLNSVMPHAVGFVPANATKQATIHTHTFFNRIEMNFFSIGTRYLDPSDGGGPSRTDYNNRTSSTIRSVMVNEQYIFLYTNKSTIAFRRR